MAPLPDAAYRLIRPTNPVGQVSEAHQAQFGTFAGCGVPPYPAYRARAPDKRSASGAA
ncbi:hypothetical protein [Pseudocitrobacter sp. RIT415]|uniref:hypothetical protein n=1 Tax=Pseudocitrobacter sp. RIT415 TaxID=2202163 RepID=UPI001314E389|nr:hypothetical protein [Pseudocitrobacter sp. RIT 415]